MQRISTEPDGIFKNGVPGVQRGTKFNAEWCNAVQEELANFIETAGLALNAGDSEQLWKAFVAILTGCGIAIRSDYILQVDGVGILVGNPNRFPTSGIKPNGFEVNNSSDESAGIQAGDGSAFEIYIKSGDNRSVEVRPGSVALKNWRAVQGGVNVKTFSIKVKSDLTGIEVVDEGGNRGRIIADVDGDVNGSASSATYYPNGMNPNTGLPVYQGIKLKFDAVEASLATKIASSTEADAAASGKTNMAFAALPLTIVWQPSDSYSTISDLVSAYIGSEYLSANTGKSESGALKNSCRVIHVVNYNSVERTLSGFMHNSSVNPTSDSRTSPPWGVLTVVMYGSNAFCV